jgi:hypothetical protein
VTNAKSHIFAQLSEVFEASLVSRKQAPAPKSKKSKKKQKK